MRLPVRNVARQIQFTRSQMAKFVTNGFRLAL
jgi:hypothetical protein